MEAKGESRYRIYQHAEQGGYCVLDESRQGIHWQQEICETLTAEDAEAILAALTAQADAEALRVAFATLTKNHHAVCVDLAETQGMLDASQVDAGKLAVAIEALEYIVRRGYTGASFVASQALDRIKGQGGD